MPRKNFSPRWEAIASCLAPLAMVVQAVRYVLWNALLVILVGCIVGAVGLFIMQPLGLLDNRASTIVLILVQIVAMVWAAIRLWKRW